MCFVKPNCEHKNFCYYLKFPCEIAYQLDVICVVMNRIVRQCIKKCLVSGIRTNFSVKICCYH